jgi:4-amino-4-deoxy-L-arabinose transferase-like glycosyltransferase
MPRAAGAWLTTATGAALALAAAVLFLPCLVKLPLWRAEALFALIPREMLARGDWLTPTLNGVPYLDKPPLMYWLSLAAYQIFGVSEGAARTPNLLAAMGEIWFTYLIGLRLLNPRAAWLGSFFLLTSLGFFSLHLIMYADHLITLTLVASLYAVLRWQERPQLRWAALFYLCLALGFLSKGIIGLLFPLLIGGLYALSLKQARLLALLLSWRGWALVFFLTAPWLVVMELKHPGFLKHHLLNEQIWRFLGARQPPDITPFSAPGFWLFLGLWLLPWTPLLPEALYRFWREAAGSSGAHPQTRLLLIWAAVIMGFYTLSASRVEYYPLPALPPLALVLGWRMHRIAAASRDPCLPLALALLAILGLALMVALPHLEKFLGSNRREFMGLVELVGPLARRAAVVIPLLAGVGLVLGWRRPLLALVACSLIALALVFFTFQACMALSPLMSDKMPGEYVRGRAGPNDLVVMEFIEEYEYGASLAFYAERRILMVRRGGLPQFPYPVTPAANYLISPQGLKNLWQGPMRVFVLADDAAPREAYLQAAPVQVAFTGKRLLINHPWSEAKD